MFRSALTALLVCLLMTIGNAAFAADSAKNDPPKPDPKFDQYVEQARVQLLKRIAQEGVPQAVTRTTFCRISFSIMGSGRTSVPKILTKSDPPIFGNTVKRLVDDIQFAPLNLKNCDNIDVEATASAVIAKDGGAKVKLAIDSAKKNQNYPVFRWGSLILRGLVPVVAVITLLIQTIAVVMGGWCILRQRAKSARAAKVEAAQTVEEM